MSGALAMFRRVMLLGTLPVVLVTLWWVTSAGSTDTYFPSLRTIAGAFWPTWVAGGGMSRLVTDVVPSLVRLGLGYSLAAVLGIALGALIGSFRVLRGLFEPVLEFLRAVPPPVMVPVLMLLAGIGDLMKILVVVAGCVWPILLNTVEGVRAVDEVLVDTFRSYRVTGLTRLRLLVLPSAAPQIVTGMRQALSIGIILMVISEMTAATSGIGFTVVQFQRGFALPEMWTGILLLGTLGVLLSALFSLADRRVLRWYHGLRRIQHER